MPQNILNLLKNLHGLDPLKQLFWTELNYDRQNDGLSRGDWTDTAKNALADDPILFATGGTDDAFHVIYARLSSDRLLLTAERPVISRLLQDHPYTLFIFSNQEQTDWHFVNVKYDAEDSKKRRLFRRITISPHEKLRTASERIAMLDLASISTDPDALSPLDIQTRHEEAFDVEAVTKQFFEDYQSVFHTLQDDLTNQTADRRWAHDYALQFLNRCMFLYFIQRKGWLGDDTEFLRSFWENYRAADEPADSFVDRWLNLLFFEAFNNRFHGGHRHFPNTIREALALAPYLNGGLFRENDLDGAHNFYISDQRFKGIFDFLENYNFTIAEDSPLDQEVAVDPEMIGKVYESLVNVSDEADERGDAGIFYTPRTEIDLMCRLALVDNLTNHLGAEHKNLLYEALFAFDPDDKADADGKLAQASLWEPLDTTLKGLAAVDPACGSGSFLVGLLHILDDLRDRANQWLEREESNFERKKGIIGQNLYGVDVMEWACHVAELRLWLALIIDAEFSAAALHLRNEPLLPHFSFNIRCGDSLVQEIGGMNLAIRRDEVSSVPRALKARITRLQNAKLQFFNNDPDCPYRSEKELEGEELGLFRALIDSQTQNIEKEIERLQQRIDGPREQQILTDNTVEERTDHQFELQAMEWRQQIEALTEDLNRLKETRNALRSAGGVPFVWEIAFVEIFTGEKEGFDIVIGNPPYVRQESIADPNLPRERVTTENKKEYKTKLARSVYQAFPRFFRYNPSGTVSHKLDAKSDLYIYFYFHGLSLLNPTGAFCFITSNSWLDVGYGKDLQEFLLKHCHIKQIIDNQARRSFASADVNTVICLFSAPNEKEQQGLDQTARFVTFKTAFEGILDAVIFYEIETAPERLSIQEHRTFPISQGNLLKESIDNTASTPKYTGDKWGGKYLRAPDIYWTILEKGKDKLVRLGDIAEVKRGFTTGANEFFYLNDERIQEWGIEEEFLKPVVTSMHEIERLVIEASHVQKCIFLCDLTKTELRKRAAKRTLEYITYGETLTTSKKASHTVGGVPLPEASTVSNRSIWYTVPDQEGGDFIIPRLIRQRFFVPLNKYHFRIGDMFFHGKFRNRKTSELAAALLNATLVYFLLELMGRINVSGRINIYGPEIKPLLIPNPSNFSDREAAEIIGAFNILSQREVMPIDQEIHASDRKNFDMLILKPLGLADCYEQIWDDFIAHVTDRLGKEKSLKT